MERGAHLKDLEGKAGDQLEATTMAVYIIILLYTILFLNAGF